MLNLANTTDKLQLVTDAAVTVDVHASYADYASGTVTPGRQNTAISTATTTDILAAPAASTVRNLKTLTVRNRGSAVVAVTVLYNANGTTYELHKVSLSAGDLLEFADGVGFYTVTSTTKLNTMRRVSSDIAYSAAATLADVTGLTVDLKNARVYAFEAHLFHISGATTTGAQFGVNFSQSATLVIAGNYSGVTNSVTGGAFSLGVATALNTVITAQTTGSSANTHTIIGGLIIPAADGTFAVRATAEVAATMTVKAGSWLHVQECDN